MEAIRSSETSVLTITTRHQIPEDDFLHRHRRENVKSGLEMALRGMIHIPSFMKIGISVRAVLRFCLRYLRGCNVGIIMMIHIPSFMKIGTRVRAVLRFCLRYLRGCNVGIVMIYDDIHTRHSNVVREKYTDTQTVR
jgi:hypothetical protein